MPRHGGSARGKKRRSCTSGSDHKRRASTTHRRRIHDVEENPNDSRPRLQVGGVTIYCPGGEVTEISRGARASSEPPFGVLEPTMEGQEDTDEEFMQDFIDNLAGHGQDSAVEETMAESIQPRMVTHPDDNPEIQPDNDEEVESSENSSSSGDVASSEVSSTDAYDSNPTDVLEDINDSFASALALDAPRPPWWSLLPPAGRRSHPRTGKGRPPPGEKAKKKRARVEAKRAARAEHCGTDLAAIEAELRSFVLSRGDLKAFAPMSSYGTKATQKLAGLYNLRVSLQGSGSKRFIMVSPTRATRIPQGQAQAQVEDLLEFHQKAVAAFRPSPKKTGSKPQHMPKHKQSAARPPRQTGPVVFRASGVLFDESMDVAELAPPRDGLLQAGEVQAHCAVRADYLESSEGGFAARPHMAPAMAVLATSPEAASPGLGYSFRSEVGSNSGGTPGPQPFHSAAPVAMESESSPANSRHEPPTITPFTTLRQHRSTQKKAEKLERRARRAAAADAAALPLPTPTGEQTSLAYGAFERHTAGFGSRMLAKWGFAGQGTGLGKNNQGRAEPISAASRPHRSGLGT